MTNTLMVDCYRRDAAWRLAFYRSMIRPHSDCVTVNAGSLGPGFDASGYHAVVFSGSQIMLGEEDPEPGLAGFVRSLRVPAMGICFGHQLFARSFGARVLSGKTIERFETVRLERPGPLFDGLGATVSVLESHREFVDPESIRQVGWRVYGQSDSCPVEAMHHPELPLFGLQCHPERSGETGRRIFANFYNNAVLPFLAGRLQYQR
ncbi:MAG: hypothetical protein R6X13_06380 [bacterium]